MDIPTLINFTLRGLPAHESLQAECLGRPVNKHLFSRSDLWNNVYTGFEKQSNPHWFVIVKRKKKKKNKDRFVYL